MRGRFTILSSAGQRHCLREASTKMSLAELRLQQRGGFERAAMLYSRPLRHRVPVRSAGIFLIGPVPLSVGKSSGGQK
jgi:uncharacterized membrane protein